MYSSRIHSELNKTFFNENADVLYYGRVKETFGDYCTSVTILL